MKQYKKSQAGFTLLEIAIVMMISGVVMMAGARMVKLYTVNLQYEKTVYHLKNTHRALRIFKELNGRYPCPADPSLTANNANYGLERCRVQADLITNENDCNAPLAPLPVAMGCAISGSRDGDNNGFIDVVMMGIIPFRTLYTGESAMPGVSGVGNTQENGVSLYNESMRIDGWKRYISYAVTEHMSDANKHNIVNSPANPSTGGISVVDENDQTVVVDPPDSAHYIIYSSGENGRGGYTSAGQRIGDCNLPAVAPALPAPPAPGLPPVAGTVELELENCDENDGIFRKARRSLSLDNNYNDDLLLFRSRGETVLWKRSLGSPAGMSYIHNTNIGNVGVGTNTPTKELDIVGDLSAEESSIGINYCDDSDDDECLEPDAIGGAGSVCLDAGGNPDPTMVAYAIHDNKIVCRKLEWSMPAKSCTPFGIQARFIKSFSSAGNIVCCTIDGNNCIVE